MIPKKIHYCWFGNNPLPPLAIKCIESWKKYFPDYEIIEWNESNFDVNIIKYTSEAYKEKKYAFVSDYARFWILYNHGGIYFDVDVEVIKSFDDITEKGAFMGMEKSEINLTNGVAPGLGLGCNPGLGLIKEILELYSNLSFYNYDGTLNMTTIVKYTTKILLDHGLDLSKGIQLINEFWIYPPEYFCPIAYNSSKMEITQKTHSIHHFNTSWLTPTQKLKRKIVSKFLKIKLAKYLYLKIVKLKHQDK